MKAELVVIPSPGVGHIVSTLEIAKLLVDRDDRLSITVLLMKSPFDPKATTDVQSLAASCATDRIRFIELPDLHRDDESDQENKPKKSFSSLLEEQKPHVKEAVAKRALSDSPRLAGFVVDMFCTTMIDVADEFGLPSYVFFTSGAAFLGLLLHLQALHDEQNVDVTEFKDSDAELAVPSLVNPLPAKVLPSSFLSKEWVPYLFGHARKFREANGIMVNTFFELESRALTSISDGKIPPVFPVGPLLNLKGDHGTGDAGKAADIMEWLDDQPQSSVVFLCFGSMGSFDEVQVKEIACALEQSGYRFLWSLRKPPPKEKFMYPSDYTDPREALPEGFLDRTVEKGKVIGWAPQVDVLAHPAIGGFVSHCGWNSTLESVWFGVPMATWPLYAEQQFNAFELVIELGLAVEIKMDYRKDFLSDPSVTVSAAEIERGIRCLMDQDNAVRKKVKQMSENSRLAVMEGGSSHSAVGRFIQDVMGENTHN